MMVPKTTSETLKHKINPSLDLAEPQTVHVLLYTPGIWWNHSCDYFLLSLYLLRKYFNMWSLSHLHGPDWSDWRSLSDIEHDRKWAKIQNNPALCLIVFRTTSEGYFLLLISFILIGIYSSELQRWIHLNQFSHTDLSDETLSCASHYIVSVY